jgi:thiamine biosynthesis lipoprotein
VRALASYRTVDSIGLEGWSVWSTSVTIAVEPESALDAAAEILRREISAFDLACSRFRPDSELSRLIRAGRTTMPASPLFMQAVTSALRVARITGGTVDPTVGRSLLVLGYDCDYDEVRRRSPEQALVGKPDPAPGWRCVEVDEVERMIEIPPGVALDLGATAKALCADRAAHTIAFQLGVGVVVDIGGDLAVAGPPPPGGWQVSVRENSSDELEGDQCSVSVWDGGLASSGTSVRRWARGGNQLHHIVDPTTGWPAKGVWRMVTVAAGSCLDANAASTAAIVWGEEAPFRLAQFGLPARFVGSCGRVIEVGGWPSPTAGGVLAFTDKVRS